MTIKTKSNQVIKTYQFGSNEVFLCLIHIRSCKVTYFSTEQEQTQHNWMQAQDWAAFEICLDKLLQKYVGNLRSFQETKVQFGAMMWATCKELASPTLATACKTLANCDNEIELVLDCTIKMEEQKNEAIEQTIQRASTARNSRRHGKHRSNKTNRDSCAEQVKRHKHEPKYAEPIAPLAKKHTEGVKQVEKTKANTDAVLPSKPGYKKIAATGTVGSLRFDKQKQHAAAAAGDGDDSDKSATAETTDKQLSNIKEKNIFTSPNNADLLDKADLEEIEQNLQKLLNTKDKKKKATEDTTKKVEILSLDHLSAEEVLSSFEDFQVDFNEIFQTFRKKSTIRACKNKVPIELVHNLLSTDKQLKMMDRFKQQYEPDAIGNTTPYMQVYSKVLLQEWLLRLFMLQHNFTRSAALQQLREQIEYSYFLRFGNDYKIENLI